MKQLSFLSFFTCLLLLTSCGGDDPTVVQSERCNNGAKATLSLTIDGVGTFNFEESTAAISHATDTEGLGIDALSMFMRWPDSGLGKEIFFDVTVENEVLAETTYTFDTLDFNGSVNFYINQNGTAEEHYTFDDWTTTINEYETFSTTSAGGFTTTRLAFVSATTSGTLDLVGGASSHAFTSTYTICPEY